MKECTTYTTCKAEYKYEDYKFVVIVDSAGRVDFRRVEKGLVFGFGTTGMYLADAFNNVDDLVHFAKQVLEDFGGKT